MCGINGIAVSPRSGRVVNRSTLERMRDSMTHRGPDGSGIFIKPGIGLGHRRLSIVDVAGGQQPMTNEDGSLHIVFNGEIYNHADHRPLLESLGHRYRTHCDTETILHLYEENGSEVVQYLRGMFAFAIWDETKQELFLARDRLGVKPLYYTLTDDGSIFFASEIKSLLAAQAVRPEINYDALPDYLANRAPSGEDTLYQGIKRLLPGHTLRWRAGRVEIKSYWTLSYHKPDDTLPESEYVDQFSELFRESVRLRLMADVPLGMFLSGGIDSSAIAAVMTEFVSTPIRTFSVAFADREANELEYARLVARSIGADHHEIVVSPTQFFDALPALVYHEDEPIAHPSSVPLFFVSQLAAKHVKVVLTGEGSDEMLAGYDKYRKTIYNMSLGSTYHRLAPDLIRRSVSGIIGRTRNSSSFANKLARTFLCLPPDIENIYFDNFSVFGRERQQSLLSESTRRRIYDQSPYDGYLKLMRQSDASSLLDQLLSADVKTYLHELLMKQDQMSMGASIESRVPFLDHKLVEFAAALPERMKLRGLKTKYILRQAMRHRLPPEILSRRKMGFPVPLGSWLRGSFTHLLDEYVLSSRARERDIFNPQFVADLVAEHRAGVNHTERLWSLINFELWQRRFFDCEAADKAPDDLMDEAMNRDTTTRSMTALRPAV